MRRRQRQPLPAAACQQQPGLEPAPAGAHMTCHPAARRLQQQQHQRQPQEQHGQNRHLVQGSTLQHLLYDCTMQACLCFVAQQLLQASVGAFADLCQHQCTSWHGLQHCQSTRCCSSAHPRGQLCCSAPTGEVESAQLLPIFADHCHRSTADSSNISKWCCCCDALSVLVAAISCCNTEHMHVRGPAR